ncbi:hypothetical protein ACL6C3_30410 [Capilliphycus salinus ALCB114379]|uniref:hypothetical protein n=1 Tax=Capilliphycus salinus TaxID=2768948 RepID=UPI0039A64AAB
MYQINNFWRRVAQMTLTTVIVSALWILQFYLISLQVSPSFKGKNIDETALVKESQSAINSIPQKLKETCTMLPSASC